MQILSEWLACPEVASFMSVTTVLITVSLQQEVCILSMRAPASAQVRKMTVMRSLSGGTGAGPPFFTTDQ